MLGVWQGDEMVKNCYDQGQGQDGLEIMCGQCQFVVDVLCNVWQIGLELVSDIVIGYFVNNI